LAGVAPEAVDENNRPLGPVGGDVDSRETHQRIRRHTDFMPVEVQVDVHDQSLHRLTLIVKFGFSLKQSAAGWITAADHSMPDLLFGGGNP
jgi:hypothetical protein